MAQNSVSAQTQERNQRLTDPREAYEGMRNLAKETESDLDRTHEELVFLVEGFRILTWHADECCEYNVDAWFRLMSRTVAKVETLRERVKDESLRNHLHKTDDPQADDRMSVATA